MPEGMETPEARDRQLVRYEETPVVAVSPVRGYVWCVFGALLGTVALPLAAYFAAFGTAMLAAQLFKKAQNGDIRAWEVLRDTVGQKPVEKIEVDTIDPQARAEMDELLGLNE